MQANKTRNRRPPHHAPRLNAPAASHNVPKLKEGNIRILTLGGVEEIGKNMTAIEIGNDIIVIDIGLAFPTEETPG